MKFAREFVLVGLMALLFIVGGKIVFTKFNVPGVSQVFAAA